jgi:hypothetical protein
MVARWRPPSGGRVVVIKWGTQSHHIIGTVVINTHTVTLEFWVRFQTRGTRENRAPPCFKVPGSSRIPAWVGSRVQIP